MAGIDVLDRPAAGAAPAAAPLEALLKATNDALTDGMVERMAITASNALEIADRLNDPDTKAAVNALIDGLTRLHRSGALDTTINLVSMLHAVREAMTDGMVERLVIFVEHMVSNLATEQIAMLAQATEHAMQDAIADTDRQEKVSLLGLMAELRKPETLKMMSFLLAFGKRMHERSEQLTQRPVE